jgi:hypothetical protein
MRREQLEHVVRAQPFRPFRIVLTNGRVHEIRHPEFFMLVPGTVIVGHPDAGEGGAPFTIVDLSHIAEAQPIGGPPPGGGNGATADGAG